VLQLTVHDILSQSGCCTECGIPIRAVNNVLHPLKLLFNQIVTRIHRCSFTRNKRMDARAQCQDFSWRCVPFNLLLRHTTHVKLQGRDGRRRPCRHQAEHAPHGAGEERYPRTRFSICSHVQARRGEQAKSNHGGVIARRGEEAKRNHEGDTANAACEKKGLQR